VGVPANDRHFHDSAIPLARGWMCRSRPLFASRCSVGVDGDPVSHAPPAHASVVIAPHTRQPRSLPPWGKRCAGARVLRVRCRARALARRRGWAWHALGQLACETIPRHARAAGFSRTAAVARSSPTGRTRGPLPGLPPDPPSPPPPDPPSLPPFMPASGRCGRQRRPSRHLRRVVPRGHTQGIRNSRAARATPCACQNRRCTCRANGERIEKRKAGAQDSLA